MLSLDGANWYLTVFDGAQPKYNEKIDYFKLYLGHLTNFLGPVTNGDVK